MSAGRICARSVDFIEPEASAQTAAERMNARNVGTLVVVNKRREPVGMITDRDLAVRVMASGRDPVECLVKDVMTTDPATVTQRTPVEDALRIMRKGPFRRIPVVDDDGQLLGVLSLDDILVLLAEEFGSIGKLLREESPEALAVVE